MCVDITYWFGVGCRQEDDPKCSPVLAVHVGFIGCTQCHRGLTLLVILYVCQSQGSLSAQENKKKKTKGKKNRRKGQGQTSEARGGAVPMSKDHHESGSPGGEETPGHSHSDKVSVNSVHQS